MPTPEKRRDPTPQEIAEIAAEIREGWSDDDFANRAVQGLTASERKKLHQWTPPIVDTKDMDL